MIVTCTGCGKRFTSRLTECPFCKTPNAEVDTQPPAHGAVPDAAPSAPPVGPGPLREPPRPTPRSLLDKQVAESEPGTNPIVFTIIKLVLVLAVVGGGLYSTKLFFTPDKPTAFIGASRGAELEMPIEKLVTATPDQLDRRLLLVAKFGKVISDDDGFRRFEAISGAGVTLPIYVAPEYAKVIDQLKPGQVFGAYGTIENKGMGFTPKPALVVK